MGARRAAETGPPGLPGRSGSSPMLSLADQQTLALCLAVVEREASRRPRRSLPSISTSGKDSKRLLRRHIDLAPRRARIVQTTRPRCCVQTTKILVRHVAVRGFAAVSSISFARTLSQRRAGRFYACSYPGAIALPVSSTRQAPVELLATAGAIRHAAGVDSPHLAAGRAHSCAARDQSLKSGAVRAAADRREREEYAGARGAHEIFPPARTARGVSAVNDRIGRRAIVRAYPEGFHNLPAAASPRRVLRAPQPDVVPSGSSTIVAVTPERVILSCAPGSPPVIAIARHPGARRKQEADHLRLPEGRPASRRVLFRQREAVELQVHSFGIALDVSGRSPYARSTTRECRTEPSDEGSVASMREREVHLTSAARVPYSFSLLAHGCTSELQRARAGSRRRVRARAYSGRAGRRGSRRGGLAARRGATSGTTTYAAPRGAGGAYFFTYRPIRRRGRTDMPGRFRHSCACAIGPRRRARRMALKPNAGEPFDHPAASA